MTHALSSLKGALQLIGRTCCDSVSYGVRANTTCGVIGLGGLGHMAVKILAAMGAEVR
jgi:D-arabinose 1-dehydrogenase-like Zn-dependent alcohol dehydrogenase